jgi:hypothetical protein
MNDTILELYAWSDTYVGGLTYSSLPSRFGINEPGRILRRTAASVLSPRDSL